MYGSRIVDLVCDVTEPRREPRMEPDRVLFQTRQAFPRCSYFAGPFPVRFREVSLSQIALCLPDFRPNPGCYTDSRSGRKRGRSRAGRLCLLYDRGARQPVVTYPVGRYDRRCRTVFVKDQRRGCLSLHLTH